MISQTILFSELPSTVSSVCELEHYFSCLKAGKQGEKTSMNTDRLSEFLSSFLVMRYPMKLVEYLMYCRTVFLTSGSDFQGRQIVSSGNSQLKCSFSRTLFFMITKILNFSIWDALLDPRQRISVSTHESL